MRRRNMREVRRCNSGERPMKRLAVALGGLVLAGALIAAVPSAQAAPARPDSNPVLGDDIYLYHPILQSVVQAPPLDTIIRFRMEAYTANVPRVFHMQVHLEWWRSARQLHRAKGAWVEIRPPVSYGLTDLPAVGTHHYLNPAEWTCHTGRLYVRVHVWGITHQGRPASTNLYFPWSGFNRKKLGKGNPYKAPALRQAWSTSCQGHDTLIG